MKNSLSNTQKHALQKLTSSWKCPYELRESIGTLDSLVRKGLAIRKYGMGARFMPRNETYYKLI